MDLPTCPSCAASVLDEDAAECPFCGAAMSSSSSAPSGKKTSEVTQPSQKQTTTRRSKRETVTDDDPFELERQQQLTNVISLLRKPVKGKMFRVVCPMCDTPGFASSKVVGKEVKCRNPECLAPVFLVPDPDVLTRKADEEKDPEAKERRASKLPLISVLVLVTASIGGAYFYFTRETDSSHLNKPFDQLSNSQANKKSFLGNTENSDNPPENNLSDSNDKKSDPLIPQTVQQEALKTIIDLSRIRKNRSKPFSRRLAAEAYAISGDIPEAQSQIERIDAVSPPLPFYKMFPLIDIGWIQLKDKDNAGLKKTIEQLEQLTKQIPQFGGRDTLDLTSRLAAFWVATDKKEAAIEIMKKYQKNDALAQLSAYLQIARETNQYDFSTLIDLRQEWDSPQWIAVTLILTAHGFPQEALNWAALAPTPIDRMDAVTQWALALVQQTVQDQKRPETALLKPAEMKLSPSGNAYMFARCARKLIALKQTDAAKAFLEKSKTFIENTPVPSPLILGNIKTVNTLTLPVSAPLIMLAQSNLQIACAASELGQQKAAIPFLKNAVQAIRASAPSVAAVQTKNSETSNFNFQNQIKDALNLDTSDRLRRGINNYRKQLRNLKSAADNRVTLLVKQLSQASRSHLEGDVWKTVLESQNAEDENLKDSLLETSLPAVILQSANQNMDTLKEQIQQELINRIPALSNEDLLIKQVTFLIQNGKPEQAAHEINQADLKKAWKGQLSLKLLSYLINESQFKQATQFVTALTDPVLREDMLNTISAASTIQNKLALSKKILENQQFSPTERISGYLGLIRGIQVLLNEQPSVTPPRNKPKNL